MRKWLPRYSLRSLLFIMAMSCGAAAAVGYEANWIRERRAFRADPKFSFVESPESSGEVADLRAPAWLWLFGERGVSFITIQVNDDEFDGETGLKKATRKVVLRAHSLFPEASIYAIDEEGDVAECLNQYWQVPDDSAWRE